MFFMWDDRRAHEAMWENELSWQLENHRKHLLAVDQELTQQALLIGHLIANDQQVTHLIRESYQVMQEEHFAGLGKRTTVMRGQLQSAMKHYWDNMLEQGGRQLSVYFAPDAVNFLRMHRPDRFGDVFHDLRPIISDPLLSGRAVQGLDIGRQGSGFRAVLPIRGDGAAQNDVIAVLEVGLMPLAFHRASNQDVQMAMLLRKSVTDPLLWENVRQELNQLNPTILDDWRIEGSTDPLMHQWWRQGLITVRQPSQLIHSDGKTYHCSWLPLNLFSANANQEAVAALVWQDVTESYDAYLAAQRKVVEKWSIALVCALFLLWAFSRLNRRYVKFLLSQHSVELQAEHLASEQARQHLALALRSSDSGFWEWDIINETASFSPEWRTLCGLPPLSSGAQDLDEWMSRVHPADKRISYSEMIRHIKGETPMYENEYRIRIHDGSYKWILTRGKVVKWTPTGKAALMLGVYSDITERKNTELHSIRQQAALHALNEIASMPSLDSDEQLRRGLALGARYLAVGCGVISEIKEQEYKVRVQHSPNHELSDGDVYQLNQTYCQFTMAEKDIVAKDNILPGEFNSVLQRDTVRLETYIGAPLWVQGRIYGTLCFFSHKSRQHEYDSLDKDFVRLLSRWISAVVERWQYDQEKKIILQRFQKLSERLPGFMYQFQLRPDGSSCYPYASSGIKNIYNIHPEDVRESASIVFSLLHPDDLAWVSQTLSSSAAKLTPWVATVRVNHPVRGLIWTHAQAVPERLSDGSVLWYGYVSDITSLKQTEIALAATNSLRQAIFDAANIAIIATDITGTIKTFNRGAEHMLGYSADELIDQATLEQLHITSELEVRAKQLSHEMGADISSNIEAIIARAREGADDENEWIYVRKDGVKIPVTLTVTALRDEEGEVNGFLAIARDISELKRIDTMKTEFISTVSHELRTPLTSISGALSLLNNKMVGELPLPAANMIRIAHNNSQRLILLVNDLLDMEKLVAGKMSFDLRTHKMKSLIQVALEANASYAQQYNVTYQLDPSSRDAVLVTDAMRIEQVLSNFLSNAAKFSPANEVVTVKCENLFGRVRVTVKDNGAGIPDEFRSRIFKKFAQADSTDTRRKGGTGLGLAICKEIIERLGGKVGFESRPQEGSSFYFELPAIDETPKMPLAHEYEGKKQTNILLLTTDTPWVPRLIPSLGSVGYFVDQVSNNQEALEYLELRHYHAVILDDAMLGIQTAELLDRIFEIQEANNNASTVPVIVIGEQLEDAKHRLPPHIKHERIVWIAASTCVEQCTSVLHKITTLSPSSLAS